MILYTVHNYDLNVSVEMTEEELETYAPEIQNGTMEIFETMEVDI